MHNAIRRYIPSRGISGYGARKSSESWWNDVVHFCILQHGREWEWHCMILHDMVFLVWLHFRFSCFWLYLSTIYEMFEYRYFCASTLHDTNN